MGIESVGGQAQMPSFDPTAMAEAGGKIQQLASEIAPLFGTGGSVNVRETRRTEDGDATHTTVDAPQLDEADIEAIAATLVDLEALIAELQAECDEAQILAAKERIEAMMGEITAQHEQTMDLVAESLDAMREQEKMDKLMDILGWLGVGLAILGVVAAIFTGGAAAIAIAAIGAALAITLQVMNETGAMEDLLEALAKSIKETFGCNSEEADAAAQLILAAIEIIIAIACICAGQFGAAGSAVANVSQATQKAIKAAMLVAGLVMGAVGLGANIASTVINYKAGMTEADVTEAEAILKKLQELLDQESEDLQQLIQQLNDAMAAVIELLGSRQDALNTMSMTIGA